MNNAETLSTQQILTLSGVYVGSIFGFLLVYQALTVYFERSMSATSEYKTRWTPQKKADFISRITSQLHALIGIGLSVNALFFTCVEKNGNLANFFTSDYCLMEHFDIMQMVTLSFTAGYLTYDTYICYAKIQEKSKLQTQTYIHHGVGISGVLAALFYGSGGALIISNVLLINEFSTFFLNYRQFLLIFKMHESQWYSLNAIAFFFAFLLSRILFNSVVAFWVGRAFYLTTKDNGVLACPIWQIVLGFYLIFIFVTFYILNLIWFTGILKHLKRNIQTLKGLQQKSELTEQLIEEQSNGPEQSMEMKQDEQTKLSGKNQLRKRDIKQEEQ